MKHATPPTDSKPPPAVFVFGANLRGAHGKGAALFALHSRGAVLGQAEGRQGNAYAIPTKDAALRTLPLASITDAVERFLAYARAHPETAFEVTAIGCGLAGLHPAQIAPLFATAPPNCTLPERFLPFVPERGQKRVRSVLETRSATATVPAHRRLTIHAATASLLDAAIRAAFQRGWSLQTADHRRELTALFTKPLDPTTE